MVLLTFLFYDEKQGFLSIYVCIFENFYFVFLKFLKVEAPQVEDITLAQIVLGQQEDFNGGNTVVLSSILYHFYLNLSFTFATLSSYLFLHLDYISQ